MMDDGDSRDTRRLALAVGGVAIGTVGCLATYFAVGGPFGSINDIGNGALGLLSAGLAWRLRDRLSGRGRGLALGLAAVGAALTVVGSALVLSRTTGFLLAGLVSSVGFAGIGVWLVTLSRGEWAREAWPDRVRFLAVAAGVLMAIGIVVVPAIVQRVDDMATAPWWVWLGFVGWLGIYVAYPAWAIRWGLLATRQARPDLPLGEGTATG
jgi:hypothetical protein